MIVDAQLAFSAFEIKMILENQNSDLEKQYESEQSFVGKR